MHDAERYCPSCAAVVAFEQPPCPDGHDECPELACTLCGTAVFAGVAVPLDPTPVEEHYAA
ncbi:MAG: hypothetical protein ACRDMV_14020 [Streptosporangiales bacterium]